MATSNSGGEIDKVICKLLGSKLCVTNTKIIKSRKLPIRKRLSNWLIPDILNLVDDHATGTSLCRDCGLLFSPRNNICCYDCLNKLHNFVTGIPKSVVIKYCKGCQSYSFTGRTDFFSAPARSASLMSFLLRRIGFHLYKLQLSVCSASFLPSIPGTENIRIDLKLVDELPDRLKPMKHHIVEYIVTDQTCGTCSNMGTALNWKSAVKVRQFGGDQQRLVSLFTQLPRHALDHQVKMCIRVSNGVDLFFANNIDSLAFYNLLCSLVPIMPTEPSKSAEESCINAVVCPLSFCDLVPIHSADMVNWGFSSSVALCAEVSSSITFVDPLSLKQRTLNSAEYWNSPAIPLRTARDLLEYLVVDVQIISTENVYALADIEVARLSDFGRRDETFTVRSHLGHILKPGNHVLGYNMSAFHISKLEKTVPLPDVVLVKKKHFSERVQRKNTSPEYEEFLRDLDKNSQAMFNLSLNNVNNAENQQSQTASVGSEEGSEFDLEGLLADLHLGSIENVGTSCGLQLPSHSLT